MHICPEDFPAICRAAENRVLRAQAELARAEKWRRDVNKAWGKCMMAKAFGNAADVTAG